MSTAEQRFSPESISSPPTEERFVMNMDDIICIGDLQNAASAVLGKSTLAYFNDGADRGIALEENTASFDRYKIRPRILRDVSRVETQKEVFGRTMSFPLAIAPSGMQCMAHEDGEKATARASAKAGLFMGVSTFATTSLEDIKASGDEVGDNVYMLQLYVFKNRQTTENLVRRAEAAGYKAVLLTCDTPKPGNRYNMTRNKFKMPSHLELPNLGQKTLGGIRFQAVADSAETVFTTTDDNMIDDSMTWEETLVWLRSITNMEIWLKGVTTAEDVTLAINSAANISGIIVSNHGGRQLESALATLDSLPECVAAATAGSAKGRKIQVWLDGGIRTGSDIFKALALGADGVMIGRVPLWGLAVGGEAGVAKALEIFRAEFQHTMALAGCRTLADIKTSCLAKRQQGGFYARL